MYEYIYLSIYLDGLRWFWQHRSGGWTVYLQVLQGEKERDLSVQNLLSGLATNMYKKLCFLFTNFYLLCQIMIYHRFIQKRIFFFFNESETF